MQPWWWHKAPNPSGFCWSCPKHAVLVAGGMQGFGNATLQSNFGLQSGLQNRLVSALNCLLSDVPLHRCFRKSLGCQRMFIDMLRHTAILHTGQPSNCSMLKR